MLLYIFFLILPIHSIAMDFAAQNKIPPVEIRQQSTLRTDTINTRLNTLFKGDIICCCSWEKNFSQDNHFYLLKIVNSYYSSKKGIDWQDIHLLKKKNHFFAETINYFVEIAWKNLDNVTFATLDIVTDYKKQQPTPQLNKLSHYAKKYVMCAAYNKTKRVHYVEFAAHTAPVIRIDINPHALLASSTSRDKTFRLWSLATGKEICTFPETASHGYVKFDNDGNLLATATLSQKKPLTFDIKIWDTQSKKNLWSIKHSGTFEALTFFQHDKKITFAILGKSTSTLYKLKMDMDPIHQGTSHQKLLITKDKIDQEYTIKRDGNNWIAAKRAPRLYLYERAIENTIHSPISINLESMPFFNSFIESEQAVIKEMMKKNGLNSYAPIN